VITAKMAMFSSTCSPASQKLRTVASGNWTKNSGNFVRYFSKSPPPNRSPSRMAHRSAGVSPASSRGVLAPCSHQRKNAFKLPTETAAQPIRQRSQFRVRATCRRFRLADPATAGPVPKRGRARALQIKTFAILI
jgi:hypothetical protein